jgi:hypothetical protein
MKRGRVFAYDADYVERRKAGLNRRHLQPFADLLSMRAKNLSHEKLRERILARLKEADEDRLTDIAWWIASLRNRGRPRGSRTKLTDKRLLASEWIKEQLRRRKRQWCKEHKRVRVPRDVAKKLIKELIAGVPTRYSEIKAPFKVDDFLR